MPGRHPVARCTRRWWAPARWLLGRRALMAFGASRHPVEAGYAGVGPNFLPWVVAGGAAAVRRLLLWEARSGGFREMEALGRERGDWPRAWPGWRRRAGQRGADHHIGFVLSCTLCFMLAVRGLRRSEGKGGGGVRLAARLPSPAG
jgi:putative tricarboxylic transport membrane protein